jgi:hypothetical protein
VKPDLSNDGTVRKFKARLVVKGFSQRAGIDYDETFAPVAHHQSLRILLALAAQYSMQLHQIDVVGAFLNGDVEEEIYMKQPEGFVAEGQERAVCKLNKALYGLKQAGMIWNQKLDSFLVEKLQFRRTLADPCIYTYQDGDSIVLLGVHVDDILFVHNNSAICKQMINQISQTWEITDLGTPSRLLGMQVFQDHEKRSIFINQAEYIDELLLKFRMVDCKPAETPHQPGLYLTVSMCPTNQGEKAKMQNAPYAELVGSLNWLASNSRPDISTAVGTLCRFISNPGRQHWKAAQQVLRYLSGTKHHGIAFEKQKDQPEIVGFSDADWAGDPDTRRSTTGYIFMLAGGPVSWKSKLQPSTSLSSVEAEYVALCGAVREAVWLRQLLTELGFPSKGPTTIAEDNKGCISVSSNNRTDSRTKHIDVKYHYVRQMVKNRQVTVHYTPTEEMLADVLTKPTSTRKFNAFTKLLVRSPDISLRGRVGTQTNDSSSMKNPEQKDRAEEPLMVKQDLGHQLRLSSVVMKDR